MIDRIDAAIAFCNHVDEVVGKVGTIAVDAVKTRCLLQDLRALAADQDASAALAIPEECPHMIVFDDPDCKPITFAGSNARTYALKKWADVSLAWNAHLFVRVAVNAKDAPYPSATVAASPAPEHAQRAEFFGWAVGAKKLHGGTTDWRLTFSAPSADPESHALGVEIISLFRKIAQRAEVEHAQDSAPSSEPPLDAYECLRRYQGTDDYRLATVDAAYVRGFAIGAEMQARAALAAGDQQEKA